MPGAWPSGQQQARGDCHRQSDTAIDLAKCSVPAAPFGSVFPATEAVMGAAPGHHCREYRAPVMVGIKLCKLRYAGSALAPCHNDRARVCAGTNGRPQLRGTAGRGPSAQAARITQTRDSDCGLEGQVGDAGAADGQQPESVTTGEPARRPVRIMTAKPAIAPIHVDGSTCVPGRSTRWMLFPVCERQGVEADRERGR
jgi:hypothetical protein